MKITEFAEKFLNNLPFEPNEQQLGVVAALSRFCSPLMPSESVFLLMGYAGTGKTSLTSALVKTLREIRRPVVLMAPTGRAAKVFSKMSGYKAFTIHRKIYKSDENGVWSSDVAYNPLRNGIFIVDESSMIGDNSGSDNGVNLLDDLMQYVYSGDGCKMIFLGDSAQLPPVGYKESPALNVTKLKSYGMRVSRAMLTEVVRQKKNSGILYNATWMRKSMLLENIPEMRFRIKGFDDVKIVEGNELQDAIESSYANVGIENSIVVTRSNRRSVLYNQAIREKILGREEELTKGERLLVVKNNYVWSVGVKGLDFIANGDLGVVESIYDIESRYGFRFANVRLSFPDLEKELDCKILLDTLTGDGPNLSQEDINRLYEGVLNDHDMFGPEVPMSYRIRVAKSNPYLNALQVKYGYAVTCHKSQGGQWKEVYIDMGRTEDELTNKEFYRWMYTATTRATDKLCLINPCCQII